MKKITITLTEKEIMEFIGRPNSTYYSWKKRRPIEYTLIKEALYVRKLQAELKKGTLK